MADTNTISRRGALDAATAGGDAFREGKDPKGCPYLGGDDVADRFLAHYWNKGFVAASDDA